MANQGSDVRAPLSRGVIAGAALGYIDRHGLGDLSMRKLGSELGVEAMSLYNHIASKDDLHTAVSDLLYREISDDYRPDPDGDWVVRAREMARAYRAVGLRHPEAFSLMVDKPVSGEAGLRWFAEIFAIFTSATPDLPKAALAFVTAGAWLVGTIEMELGLMRRLRDGEGFDVADLPDALLPLGEFRDACLGFTEDERFEIGLDTILEGLRAKLL